MGIGERALPLNWRWATIAELAAKEPNAITDGPFGSKLKTAHYTSSGPRVIRLQNIGDGVFVDAPAHILEQHYASLQKHRVFGGDLVIAALGENPPRACILPDWLGPAIVKADCIRLKTRPNVLAEFVNFALNSEHIRRRTKKVVHGVGRPRLNLSEIKSITIPLPPFDTQKRIVAEIEKHFTRLKTPAISKMLRLAKHLHWADSHSVLLRVATFSAICAKKIGITWTNNSVWGRKGVTKWGKVGKGGKKS